MAVITVGNEPINRASSTTANVTRVDMLSGATGTGKINQIEIYVATAITGGLQVALFSAVGNNLTTRSVVDLGTAAAGYNLYTTDSLGNPIDMDVVTGDFIGFYGNDGAVDIGATALNSQWWKTGDNIPCTNTAFSTATGRIMSILGTGTDGVVAGTNTKINIGDAWKDVTEIKINIGDTWKTVTSIKQNIGDVWKDIF